MSLMALKIELLKGLKNKKSENFIKK